MKETTSRIMMIEPYASTTSSFLEVENGTHTILQLFDIWSALLAVRSGGGAADGGGDDGDAGRALGDACLRGPRTGRCQAAGALAFWEFNRTLFERLELDDRHPAAVRGPARLPAPPAPASASASSSGERGRAEHRGGAPTAPPPAADPRRRLSALDVDDCCSGRAKLLRAEAVLGAARRRPHRVPPPPGKVAAAAAAGEEAPRLVEAGDGRLVHAEAALLFVWLPHSREGDALERAAYAALRAWRPPVGTPPEAALRLRPFSEAMAADAAEQVRVTIESLSERCARRRAAMTCVVALPWARRTCPPRPPAMPIQLPMRRR